MDEYTSPVLAPAATTGNLSDIVVDNAIQAPHKVVFKRRAGDRWLDVTCREFLTEVNGVAKGLMAAGIGQGDRVALMSKTRYEWTLVDFAIWIAGAVTVPIYETSSAEQVQWILERLGRGGLLRRDAGPRRRGRRGPRRPSATLDARVDHRDRRRSTT